MTPWFARTSTAVVAAAAVGLGLAGPSIAAPAAAPDPNPGVTKYLTTAPGDLLSQGDAERKRPPGQSVQALLDRAVADGAVGIVARVDNRNPGRPDPAWSAGLKAYGTNQPADKESAFRIASNTKTMVATLVMQEIARGRWSLTTTVDRVLPGALPGHGGVTVEQLLSHTSGMPDGLGVMIAARASDPTSFKSVFAATSLAYSSKDMVRAATRTPWLFEPGSSWSYSNAGYALLGMMLEKVNHAPVGTLLRQRVFGPAGMTQTHYPTGVWLPSNALMGEAFTAEGAFAMAGFNASTFGPAGAVVSTTRDLNRFNSALMSGRLLPRYLVEQMMTPRVTTPLPYGLGMYLVPDLCDRSGMSFLYGHDGAAFGTISQVLGSPDGKRQLSIGVTGRYYDPTDPYAAQPYDLDAMLKALVVASC